MKTKNHSFKKMLTYLIADGMTYQQAKDIIVDKDLLFEALLLAIEDYPSFEETYSMTEWVALSTFIANLVNGSADFDKFMDSMIDEQIEPEITSDFVTYEEDGQLSVGIKVYGMIPEGFDDITEEEDEPVAVKYILIPIGEEREIEFTDIETKKVRVSWNSNVAYVDVYDSDDSNIFEESVEVETEDNNVFVPVKLLTDTFGKTFRLVFENPTDDSVKYVLETSKGLGFKVFEIRESRFGANTYIVNKETLESITGGDYDDYVKILKTYLIDGVDIYEMPIVDKTALAESEDLTLDPNYIYTGDTTLKVTPRIIDIHNALNYNDDWINWINENSEHYPFDLSFDETLIGESSSNIVIDSLDTAIDLWREYLELLLKNNPYNNEKLENAINFVNSIGDDSLLNDFVNDITSDYQFDPESEEYKGFLNMDPSNGDMTEYSEIWDNMEKYKPILDKLFRTKGFHIGSIVYGDNGEIVEFIVSD